MYELHSFKREWRKRIVVEFYNFLKEIIQMYGEGERFDGKVEMAKRLIGTGLVNKKVREM